MLCALLITRPAYEVTTRYLYRWSERIIDEARRKGCEVLDLAREKANKDRFLGTLRKKSSEWMLVMINGHGNEREIAGQDDETIITDEEADSLANKIVYARACASAKILGPRAVEEGAVAYIGYDVDFIFFSEDENISRPLEDATATLFLAPSNYVSIALLKGHTTGEANQRSRTKFLQNIKLILAEGAGSSHYYTIPFLFDDMTHQVCIGNQEAKLQ